MPITLTADHIIETPRRSFTVEEIVYLAEVYLARTKDTLALEAQGQELIASGFQQDVLEQFIRDTCSWGGYAGIAGRVLRRNETAHIQAQFCMAEKLLQREQPDIVATLRSIRAVKGLGVSFASKHLRLVWPRWCPVLDSISSDGLGYPARSEGYGHFTADCTIIARRLTDLHTPNPAKRPEGAWFAADVEMALFANLRGWA